MFKGLYVEIQLINLNFSNNFTGNDAIFTEIGAFFVIIGANPAKIGVILPKIGALFGNNGSHFAASGSIPAVMGANEIEIRERIKRGGFQNVSQVF